MKRNKKETGYVTQYYILTKPCPICTLTFIFYVIISKLDIWVLLCFNVLFIASAFIDKFFKKIGDTFLYQEEISDLSQSKNCNCYNI